MNKGQIQFPNMNVLIQIRFKKKKNFNILIGP